MTTATPQTKMPTSLAKIMIYAPPDLKEAIEYLAKKENRSLSNYIVTTLQRVVEEEIANGTIPKPLPVEKT